MRLDHTDRRILALLQQDHRTTTMEKLLLQFLRVQAQR